MSSVTRSLGWLMGSTALLIGCTPEGKPIEPVRPSSSVSGETERAVLARGHDLYRQPCAACHGAMAQGAPDWHKLDPDKRFPPPLNGNGHTWHHPQSQLVATVKFGTLNRGGNMPPWKDKLSDSDSDAILAWLRSNWPPKVYTQWQKIDEAARAKLGN